MFAKNKKNKNKGQVLVLVALSLVVFIGFAALAIDVGYFYHTKNQLQGAADAAALAGAAKLDNPCDPDEDAVRAEADAFAKKNYAAGSPVVLDINNDITIGQWKNDDCSVPGGGEIKDCVKVIARRTEGSPGGPVSTFFGKIFNIPTVNISATAIAAKFKAPILPIAVNEYWLEDSNKQPYDDCVHRYPSSFVRYSTVGPISESCVDKNGNDIPAGSKVSPAFGRTFAILGEAANDNMEVPGIQNANSYVNLDIRTSRHDGMGSSWYSINTGSMTPITCSNCSAGLTGPTTKNLGMVSSTKFDESVKYLHEGYPPNYILPTAVKERYINDYPNSSFKNYTIPTSECPYATVAYFPSSGKPPINRKFPPSNGQTFNQRFEKNDNLVAMVYDGAFKPDTEPNAPNAVTIVGYTLLQIDGYASGNPKNLDFNNLGTDGNTAYAHALKAIIEPTESISGKCDDDFFQEIKNIGCGDPVVDLQWEGARVRLVK